MAIIGMGLLGLLIGGMINALADSLPVDKKVHLPECHSCGAPRPWFAWFGFLGLLVGGRTCAYCGIRRGKRAAVVEIVASLGTIWIFTSQPSPARIASSILVSAIFLLIAVIDLERRLILHVVSLPAAIIIGLLGILSPSPGALRTLAGGAVGFIAVLGLFLLGEAFTKAVNRLRGRPLDEVAFGFGDVNLAGLIGLAVGWPGVVAALLVGMLAAGLFSLGYLIVMFLRRSYSAFTPIPYGPFLIIGAFLVYF
ncbi:MAG TPA: A24 family peptidase [Anaerolineales bacterium]|nr:A24 family peptidase [Anaerolineales bacterium]